MYPIKELDVIHSVAKFLYLAFKHRSLGLIFLPSFSLYSSLSVCVCACARACVCVFVHVCMHATVTGYSADLNQHVLMFKMFCLYTPL